jgi:hypothetical protein
VVLANRLIMEWIKDERRPDIIEKIDSWGKSKKVVVLEKGGEVVVAEYNKGVEEGIDWEQWYCPAYEDVIEGVIGWSDCIPNVC